MPDVEFVAEPPDEPDGGGSSLRLRPPGPRVFAALGVLAFVTVAIVVVGRSNGRPADHATSPATTAATPTNAPRSTLAVPESVVFGPRSIDVLSIGNRVVALTPTLVGVADRDGGALTVRPAPLDLTGDERTGHLFYDAVQHRLWVVSIAGTAIGAYDLAHLDSLGDSVAPYPINAAAAMDGRLWITTDHGLWVVPSARGRPERVPGPATRLGAIAADPVRHRLFVADFGTTTTLRTWWTAGPVATKRLPLSTESLAVVGGSVWVAGARGTHAAVIRLDGDSLAQDGTSAVAGQLGTRATIAAVYGQRLLLRGEPREELSCVDGRTGELRQQWPGPSGATTLNGRGVLVASGDAIETLNARDCLAG